MIGNRPHFCLSPPKTGRNFPNNFFLSHFVEADTLEFHAYAEVLDNGMPGDHPVNKMLWFERRFCYV